MKRLRRLLAAFAFMAGGFAAELAKPVYCSLLNATSSAAACRRKRAKV